MLELGSLVFCLL